MTNQKIQKMAKTTIVGEVIRMGETEQITEKFRKKEVVINEKTDGYGSTLKIQAVNEIIDEIEKVGIGDVISTSCKVEGKQWKNSNGEMVVFNNITIQSFYVLVHGAVNAKKDSIKGEMPSDEEAQKQSDYISELNPEDEDDLPF